MNVQSIVNSKLSLAAIASAGNGTVAYVVPPGKQAMLVSAWVSRVDTVTTTYDLTASIHRTVGGTVGSSQAVADSNLLARLQCFPNSFDPASMPTILLREGESITISRIGAGTLTGVVVIAVMELAN